MPFSYRIGNRTDSDKSESSILHSLYELRKDYNASCELTFLNCKWTPRIIQSLYKLLVRDGRNFSTIKFFNCDISNNNTLFAEILTMLLVYNVTESLIIKGRNSVCRSGRNGDEEEITSTYESSLDVSILTALREGISVNTSIKSLRLSGLTFSFIGNNNDNVNKNESSRWWRSLITNKSITNLDLSGSHLSQSTVTHLSGALSLNTTLQSFNVSRCYLNDESLSKIVRCIQQHPTLTRLNLSYNYLAKSTTTQAVDAVTDLLRSKNSVLKCLDLSHQQQPKRIPQKEEGKVLVSEEEQRRKNATGFNNALHALCSNTILQTIDLSGNIGCFADICNVKALSECLVSNTTLCRVDISCCCLDTDGINYLARHCLPRCSDRLKSLIIFSDGNEEDTDQCFDKSTIQSLAKGLQFNTTLENLGCGQSLKYDYVQHLLNSNRGGRRAFRSNNLPLAAWTYVLARADKIEYDDENTCISDNDNCSDNKADGESSFASITTVASASVLFELLRGPALLERK
mmetsp:Transcript_44545/g.50297  ORF Transcript_44545/g.50297 Transcript_44545/m.50297 type:complete len:516 (-) Transcript_44545:89-1636(-)